MPDKIFARSFFKADKIIMWSYYGSKSKIVNHYPPPKFDKIIEPFAGTARYALKYFDREVLIVDKYEVIVDVWHYLQGASENDILRLPKLKQGDDLRKIKSLSDIERKFLGFIVASAQQCPANIVSKFGYIHLYGANRRNKLEVIAENLHKIKHWEVIHGDFRQLPNEKATWFIDPPYQVGGDKYKHHEIDYEFLAEWCRERSGQAIVCENTNSNWLPFKPMVVMRGQHKVTTEVIWSNIPNAFENEQLAMNL